MQSPHLPNLFLIGAGKAGSTLIWEILKQCPQIQMSRVKEPDFFSVDSMWCRGLDWYLTNFVVLGSTVYRYLGEASNSYSAIDFYPNTIKRIRSVTNQPKIIYTVRNPCRRIESDWMEASLDPTFHESFSVYMRDYPLPAAKNQYLTNYQAYSNAFGPDNVHVIFFEDLLLSPRATLSKLYSFLDLDPSDQLLDLPSEPKGATSGSLRPPSILGNLRRRRGYTRFSNIVPDSFKRIFLASICRPMDISRPIWTTADTDYFHSAYYDQSVRFLLLHGKSPSFWSFENR